MTRACVIFDAHHPKHYLTVRQLGRRCEAHGIEVIWTARDKDVLVDLMREDGLDPAVLTKAQKGLPRLFGELLSYDWKLARIARRLKPGVLLGKTISVAQVGKILRIPSIVLNDDDKSANPQYPRLAYPFATRIVTPECLGENHGPRHRTFPGLCELAYLHPNVFKPNTAILEELGVPAGTPIYLLRMVALNASHDIGAKGLPQSTVHELVEKLKERGRVFISCESALPPVLEPFRLPLAVSKVHHLIAASDLLIGDSQTMAAEAAVLGTPSIRMNSFVGRIAYLEALEHRFRLTFGFTPLQKDEMVGKIDDLLNTPNLKEEWARRRSKMLEEWIDPTDVFWEELCRFVRPPN